MLIFCNKHDGTVHTWTTANGHWSYTVGETYNITAVDNGNGQISYVKTIYSEPIKSEQDVKPDALDILLNI